MGTNLVSLISDIAVGVSAIIVAIVAFYGLRIWRKELTGKARFEVARNVMLLGLKSKADFEWARNPFTSSGEHATRSRRENESSDVSMVLDEWYARDRRLVPLREDLSKLQEAGWEAKVLLGKDASKLVSGAIKVFINSYAELSSAIESYFEGRYKEANETGVNIDQDWLGELRRVIYFTREDNLSKRIEQAADQLASVLRGYVK